MFNISQFFSRVKGKQAQEILLRQAISDSLSKEGITAPTESINFKSSTATISGLSGAAKSQLYIKKERILVMINSAQKIRLITDIS